MLTCEIDGEWKVDGAPLGGSCSKDGESVEKCLQPTLPKCVDRNTYCTPPPLNKMNDDGSINSFMKIEFDQEPNYPYVPNTMIKYWCSGIENIAIIFCCIYT